MEIQETRQGAVTVVKPMGPICQSDAAQFKSAVDDVRQRSLGRFVIDAGAVAYVDSPGLEALVELSEALLQAGQSLRLCGTNATVREALELTGLADLFEHFEDANTAVRSFL